MSKENEDNAIEIEVSEDSIEPGDGIMLRFAKRIFFDWARKIRANVIVLRFPSWRTSEPDESDEQ